MKHSGSVEDLQTMIRGVGREITSAGKSGNAYQIKMRDGAILNWYEYTGTIQFQGKAEAKSKLEADLATYTGTTITSAPTIPSSVPTDTSNIPQHNASKVFIVHGHDTVAREQLELVVVGSQIRS